MHYVITLFIIAIIVVIIVSGSRKSLIPSIWKIDNLLQKWVPKKKYNSEDKYVKDLFNYLKYRLRDKIKKRRGRRLGGRRYEDLLYNKIYPIELKYNFSQKSYTELRTQIPDYIDELKHINRKQLNLIDKIKIFFFDTCILPISFFIHIKVFIVICGVKNQSALIAYKKEWGKKSKVKTYVKDL